MEAGAIAFPVGSLPRFTAPCPSAYTSTPSGLRFEAHRVSLHSAGELCVRGTASEKASRESKAAGVRAWTWKPNPVETIELEKPRWKARP